MDLNMNDLVIFGEEFAISNYKRTSNTSGGNSFNTGCLNYGVQEGYRVGDHPTDDDGCELRLGLGSYHDDYSSVGHDAMEPPAQQVPSLADDADPTKLSLGLPSELEDPAATASDEYGNLSRYDEGSMSAKLSSSTVNSGKHHILESPEISAATTDWSVELASDPAATRKAPRKCRFNGCSKGARGATGLCIAHGGGQRCLRPGCHKGAESQTAFCKAHGGGQRCQQLGCTKSAEGKTEFCIAHGGGRRCGHPGCAKAARGRSGLCIRHGGGKRCAVEGCSRSAEGQLGRCISHGGGRRCQYHDCTKGAQGSTMYCKAHGGGKRCVFEGCTKGAEGSTPLCKAHGGGKRCLYDGGGACSKSVHGGTDYCVAHGGGKRCSVAGCTKSARGRTDCCVRHGGGKHCKFENCAKSAQGSTDFCKAHGGGKRCEWAQGCEKFSRGRSGLCAAHASLMASRSDHKSSKLDQYTCSTASTSSQSMLLMKFPSTVVTSRISKHATTYEREVPEGRVHGGGLMSLLGGDFRFSVDSDQEFDDSDSCA